MKKIFLLGLLLVCLGIVVACEGQSDEIASVDIDPLRVISLGPAVTEILVELGHVGALVAIDEHAADIPGLPEGLPLLSLMPVDAEQLMALAPDLVFAAGIVRVEGDDPLAIIAEAGIQIVDVPYSACIDEIFGDIRLIAETMGTVRAGEELISGMEAEIAEIREIAATISARRVVYFEISSAPWMFTTGSGTFLHEMIELVGAVNVFANESSWMPVADEVILAANPDVILTNVSYLDDPIAEIASRPGWSEAMDAVQSGNVFMIPTNASSRPSHNILAAIWAIGEAVYPEYFN